MLYLLLLSETSNGRSILSRLATFLGVSLSSAAHLALFPHAFLFTHSWQCHSFTYAGVRQAMWNPWSQQSHNNVQFSLSERWQIWHVETSAKQFGGAQSIACTAAISPVASAATPPVASAATPLSPLLRPPPLLRTLLMHR